MRVMLCGGTGFIGTALARALEARGDEAWIITRHKPAAPAAGFRYATWDEWAADPALGGAVDGIVNLAGESINQRWTAAAKERIVQSRVRAAERIADIVRRMEAPPGVVANASGISLYGHSYTGEGRGISSASATFLNERGEAIQPFDESAPVQPADFLGRTIIEWEAAADRIPAERLVKLRIGLVLGRGGGAFPLLRLPHRLFVGGRMGSGRQGMPWIHLDDMVSLILFSLDTPTLSGPVNAIGPEPVDNDAFGRTLGRVIGRPHWFPVPGGLLRAVLGEMSCLLLTGQHATPRRALDHGFVFRYPRLEEALKNLLR
ncbi:epimerase [Cohnella nanjingensis]|uniref:DUF1731 domain-containing protein n=1 Tax=Cohnella nanjingensis TaxID=1387779 RepID=A0A7X0RW77_9BACL|nr:DUF1731 domain-containing protein [Cohnella nanjingensis]MBB6674787.1 DUF1731 domain-containing protein [Cohnella nanjingensis]